MEMKKVEKKLKMEMNKSEILSKNWIELVKWIDWIGYAERHLILCLSGSQGTKTKKKNKTKFHEIKINVIPFIEK